LEYFEDYNLSLTQRLGKIAILGQPPRPIGPNFDLPPKGTFETLDLNLSTRILKYGIVL
jgi:hypothetical protein